MKWTSMLAWLAPDQRVVGTPLCSKRGPNRRCWAKTRQHLQHIRNSLVLASLCKIGMVTSYTIIDLAT